MIQQDLVFCRKCALEILSLERQKGEIRGAASGASGVRYGEDVRGGNRPLAKQQAFVERVERLEQRIEALRQVRRQVWQRWEADFLRLSLLQRQLITGYYFYGYAWEPINAACGVNRQKSLYEVRKALQKIDKSA